MCFYGLVAEVGGEYDGVGSYYVGECDVDAVVQSTLLGWG